MSLELNCDVLVLGGGPAGCWAALTAREAGASVVLADKGYVGTSGATAPTNSTVHHLVADDPVQREGMIGSRLGPGRPFVDPDWVEKVYDQTTANLDKLTAWGYVWPRNEEGHLFRGNLRGPDYLLFLRKRLIAAGVRILDHSPALQLLQADDGVAGANGLCRADGKRWQVRAGAVVIATGGCAFRSGAVGTFNLTGDGYLMAAEAGAEFSGLEFTSNYAIAPAECGLTKGIIYRSATFSDEQGNVIERPKLFRALADGKRVFAVLNKSSDYVNEGYRKGQPNIFVYFQRLGADPFKESYEIHLFYEGTVRGSGGLAVDEECATTVPGLFAAGDVASRERLVGPSSSGGGPASSWASASGAFAGQAAAAFALGLGEAAHERPIQSSSPFGSGKPASVATPLDKETYERALAELHAQLLPLNRNFFRTGEGLREGLGILEKLWSELRQKAPAAQNASAAENARSEIRWRELHSMVAAGRWFFSSALAREESLGLHKRMDFPDASADSPYQLRVSGLDEIRVRRVQLSVSVEQAEEGVAA